MPRFDGTGPMGFGSRTGRGFGPCARGQRFFSLKNEIAALESEEKVLQEELEVIRREKEALKKEDKD